MSEFDTDDKKKKKIAVLIRRGLRKIPNNAESSM